MRMSAFSSKRRMRSSALELVWTRVTIELEDGFGSANIVSPLPGPRMNSTAGPSR
jgi:hypothetical protein